MIELPEADEAAGPGPGQRRPPGHPVRGPAPPEAQGGRDTERDLYGRPGGYATRLSRLTLGQPCGRCGTTILKQAYGGGAIYVCPGCQAA